MRGVSWETEALNRRSLALWLMPQRAARHHRGARRMSPAQVRRWRSGRLKLTSATITWWPFCISTDHGRSAANMARTSSGVTATSQPPQVRGHQLIHLTEQPILPARQRAGPCRRLELRDVPRPAPLHRPAVDHHRRAIASAGEEVRRVRVRLARGIDPVPPKRLGRDADHGRVEVQIQQIAFQPRLKPHMAAGSGDHHNPLRCRWPFRDVN